MRKGKRGSAKNGGSSNLDLEKDLRNAIIANDAQRMQTLFDGISAEDLEAKLLGDNGLTLLFFALDKCAEGKADVNVVQYLLQNGVKADQEDKKGNLPLPYAIAKRIGIDILKCLLENGADLHKSSKNGNPPLFCAVDVSCGIDVFELLLAKEENLNVLLAHALDKKVNIDILQLLLEKNGADLAKLSDNHKSQLLCNLLKDKDHNVVNDVRKVLIAGASLNTPDKAGIPPLHHALIIGADIAVIKLLLNSGADPKIKNKDEQNALHIAVLLGRCDVVEVLLSNAEIKKSINSVLPLAVGKGDIQMITLLLKYGVDPNQLGEDDKSRLSHHFLPQHEDVSIKKTLPKNKVKRTAAQQKCSITRNIIKTGVHFLCSVALCFAAYKMAAPWLEKEEEGSVLKDLFNTQEGPMEDQNIHEMITFGIGYMRSTAEFVLERTTISSLEVAMVNAIEIMCGSGTANDGKYTGSLCFLNKYDISASALCISKKDDSSSPLRCYFEANVTPPWWWYKEGIDEVSKEILVDFRRILLDAASDTIRQLGSVPDTGIQNVNVGNASNRLVGNCSIL